MSPLALIIRRTHSLYRHVEHLHWFLSFVLIHGAFFALWTFTIGFDIWPAAYPGARTQLVLLSFSFPTWAFVTLCSRWVLQRTRRRQIEEKGYEFVTLLGNRRGSEDERDDELLNGARPPTQFASSSSTTSDSSAMIYLSVLLLGLVLLFSHENAGDHRFRSTIEKANRSPKPEGYGRKEKVFIAAMFSNDEQILPSWSREMLKVARYIGKDNVFFSIVESNSVDATPFLLTSFRQKLIEEDFHHEFVLQGLIAPPPSTRGIQPARVEYLAAMRNMAIAPLVERGGFDRVIFSNNIIVEADTVIELLNTRDGGYDMVCGIDPGRAGLYDVWATRDSRGSFVSSLWPYFFETGAKRAVIWDEPAEALTCWGGIVAFRADPLLPIAKRKPGGLSRDIFPKPLPLSHPAYSAGNITSPALTPPIQFRTSGVRECFSSETFLLAYDFRRRFAMNKIFINPRVIVGYQWYTYYWHKYALRHWLVLWWMKLVERGNTGRMEAATLVLGGEENAYNWDGGRCMKCGEEGCELFGKY